MLSPSPRSRDQRHQSLDGQIFRYQDFAGVDFTGANLSECRFEHCCFRAAVVVDVCFIDNYFEQCDFTGARWGGNDLDGAMFQDCTHPPKYATTDVTFTSGRSAVR
jgi:uncharacterized protein YjbI with pentapeptide repeats